MTRHPSVFRCLAALAVLSACHSSTLTVSTPPEGTTTARQAPATVHAWWDLWPRPTVSNDLTQIRALHANMVIGGAGPTDEGRGPYARESGWADAKDSMLAMQAAGIHYTGWIEGQGQTRTFIISVNKLPDGTYEQDSRTGAAALVASQWSWDFNGPGVDPRSNTIKWVGLHDFVNNDSYQGPFVLSNPAFSGIASPTYPDGSSALGYLTADTSNPLHAKLYDALCAKSITGVTETDGQATPHTNTTGFLPWDVGGGNIQPLGDLSLAKDTTAPFWLQYATNVLDFGVTHGSDGFWLDNSSGWDSMNSQPTNNAFGLWSVAKFRDYLRSHAEIAVPGSIDTFDVRDYLKGRLQHLGAGWTDGRFVSDPIWLAYVAFKGESAHAYVKGNYLALKASASAAGKNPADLYLGGNDIPDITFGALNGDELDQVNTEYNPWGSLDVENQRGVPPIGHGGPFYTTAASLESSQHAIVWYYLDDPSYKNKPNLGEVLGFEAAANNVLLNTDAQWGRSPGTPASLTKVNTALERLGPTLGYRMRKGAVAIVFGSFTQATYLAPGGYVGQGASQSTPGSPSHLDASLAFAGWGEALEERHTPYRVIPDFKLGAGIPDDVSVVVLPHVRAMDAATIENVLVPFARRGGTVLITGSEAGSLKTRDGAYGSNGGALLVALTQRDLSPGSARFVQGNPGFDFFRGARDGNASRKAAALAQIEAALHPLEVAGALPVELRLSGWGPRVWGTTYATETGNRFFYDLLNADIDPTTDALTNAPGGSVTLNLPRGSTSTGATASWFDADGSGGAPLAVQPQSDGSFTVQLPAFRVWGTLVVDAVQAPSISNAGTGCDDNYCIWLVGQRFGLHPSMELLDSGGALIATYTGAELGENIAAHSLAIQLRAQSPERAALTAGPLSVRVLDGDTGLRSNAMTVTRPGGQMLTPPEVSNAGPGCDDNFCLWLITRGLSPPVSVEILDMSGMLVATYSGADLSIAATQDSLTLALKPDSPEHALFAAGPMQVRVVNIGTGLRSNLFEVVRPASGPPPTISAAGSGCDDNFCIWIIGAQLGTSVAVEVLDASGNLLATYRDGQISYDVGQQVVTLALVPGSPEHQDFSQGPLGVRVVNLGSGARSSTTMVTRP